MNFIKSFGVHIVTIAVVIILIFTTTSLILNSYTRHGESLTVPDIKGMKISEAINLLTERIVLMGSIAKS